MLIGRLRAIGEERLQLAVLHIGGIVGAADARRVTPKTGTGRAVEKNSILADRIDRQAEAQAAGQGRGYRR